MKRLTKRILIGIGISILAAGLAGIVFFIIILYPVFENRFDDRTFERGLWHTYHQSMDRDNPRGNMVDDLRENHLRRGMKKEEVLRFWVNLILKSRHMYSNISSVCGVAPV